MSFQKSISSVVCAFVLVVSFHISLSAEENKNPRVSYPETSFNFGTVPQGEKLTHDFKILNQGQSDLIIRKISAACGCTAAVAENALIKPQSSTVIRVSFDTAGFVGDKIKTIRVYTNDPLNSSQLLEVRAQLSTEFSIDKNRVEFHDVEQGTSVESSITLSKNVNTSAQVKEVFTKSSYFSVTLDKSKQIITIKTKSDAPIGKHQAVLVIKTTSTTQSVINIPLFLEVIGKIGFKPEIVQFGVMSTKHGEVTKVVRIINRAGNPYLKVSNVSTDIKDLVVYDMANQSTGDLDIYVKVTPKTPRVMRGSLTINFQDDPIDYQVPVFGVIDEDLN